MPNTRFAPAWALAALVLVLGAAVPGADARPQASADMTADYSKAAAAEVLANANLTAVLTRWDADKLRELGRNLTSLPESVASRALWMIACSPTRLDSISVFAQAMSSPSPAIRLQAADLLLADGGPDAMRFIINRVVTETEEEAVRHIIAGMAKLPIKTAMQTLMNLMLHPNAQPLVTATVAGHLRALTRTNLGDTPGAWREWWFDNEHRYQ